MTTRAQGRTDGAEPTRWVNLSRACEILGVNESTVRRWADSGELRCFRTPGGHRRFAEADLFAMTSAQGGGRRALESAAMNRIRRQLHGGRGDAGWVSDIDADEREALRPLGRRLVELVTEYLGRQRPRSAIEAEVDEIGRTYGDILHRNNTPLLQAMQAFTFFRRSLDETAKQLVLRNQLDGDEATRAREEIALLADRVLVGLAAAYET